MFKVEKAGPGAYAMIDDEATRGLYGLLFEEHIFADRIFSALNLTRAAVGRYRDAFVIKGEIAIYTRNGGENRKCPRVHHNKLDCLVMDCFSCIITHRLPKHPNYLRDVDNEFDSTFATIYFSIPKEAQFSLMAINIDWNFHPGDKKRFEEAMNRLDGAMKEAAKVGASKR